MGLLGNGFDDPQSSAIMALAGGLLQHNFAGGLLGANDAYTQAKQNAVKQKLMDMQMQNYSSEIDQRKAAIAKQQQLMDMTNRLIGGGGASPAAPGQMGSGSFGIVPPPAGATDMPAPRPAGLGGASLNDIVALHAAGGPDLLNAYKLSREGFERKPGTFYEDVSGRREYIGDPTKGFSYNGGQVGVMPGFTNANAQITASSELPKALIQSAGKVNLRTLPDNSQAPVPELTENPLLSGMFSQIFGGQQPGAAPSPRPMVAPSMPARSQMGSAPMPAPQPGVKGSFVGDPSTVSQAIAEIKDPQERSNAQAAFEAQMRAQGGRLGPYGKTTAQETQDAVDREAAISRQKDIATQRQSIAQAGFAAPTNIAKYQQIGRLLQDVDGGKLTPTGTEFASALNSVGIKIDKNLPNKQAAAALANEAALQLRSPQGGAGMPGALSDKDREFLQGMTPNQAQTAEGRKIIIQSYVALQQRNQQVDQFMRNYEKKYGKLDNGFFDQLSAWSNSNPLFGGK